MEHKQINILNVRNAFLLAVISYTLYTLLWMLADIPLRPSPTLFELAMDFVVCTIFIFISLVLSHLIFKALRFHTGFKWSLIYSCAMLLLNNFIAIAMSWICGRIYGGTGNPLFEVQGIYAFAMLATLVSSIYVITSFMNNYNLAIEEKQKAEMELAKERESVLEAQLSALKMQINPHFLFNNFSTLSELIETEPDTANLFLSHLSKVYRHIVRNLNVNLVDVRDELKFIDSYVYLMKLRHGEDIIVNIDESLRKSNGKLPPASLQLLVENAIKHNAFSSEKPLIIDMTLENGFLVMRNLKQPLTTAVESSGVGQLNIIWRYSLLSDKKVRIESTEHLYSVSLPLL